MSSFQQQKNYKACERTGKYNHVPKYRQQKLPVRATTC